LARRTPAIARARSSLLLSTIARSLDQAATGATVPGALGPSDTALLVIVGHDTNQSNLSGMLGLTWSIDGYPGDDTPPGGALLFELWRNPVSKSDSVRIKYVAQTPDQMHDEATLTFAHPPATATLTIEGCPARSDCPFRTFAAAVRNAIDPRFVR
jgi:4-phytase/acid phosphatase